MRELIASAGNLVVPGKGLLAADESPATIARRFATVGVENTEEQRRVYRQMLLTTKGIATFISGVILHDETIRQNADDGTPLARLLEREGMIVGIKVDEGAKPLAGSPGELVTEGLDDLNAMNTLPGPRPWTLSFSYSRALQEAPLATWKGDGARVAAAQKAFYHRARCNSAAAAGRYTTALEGEAAA